MISTIRWGTRFGCVLVSEDLVLPNFYEIGISFTQNTESQHEQEVALERIGVFFNQVLDNALIIHADHQLVDLFECGTDTRVLMLPTEPSIQILALALMEKISAIVQDRLLIDFVSVSSSLTGAAEYMFDLSDTDPRLTASDTWWKRADLTISDYAHELESGETIVPGLDFNWSDLGLSWEPEAITEPSAPARIVPFRPRVVPANDNTE